MYHEFTGKVICCHDGSCSIDLFDFDHSSQLNWGGYFYPPHLIILTAGLNEITIANGFEGHTSIDFLKDNAFTFLGRK